MEYISLQNSATLRAILRKGATMGNAIAGLKARASELSAGYSYDWQSDAQQYVQKSKLLVFSLQIRADRADRPRQQPRHPDRGVANGLLYRDHLNRGMANGTATDIHVQPVIMATGVVVVMELLLPIMAPNYAVATCWGW
ncbi:hypothetical protein [Neoasaia chiangmaiensis]|nr:hypothetical protein [Neoasaia chiangmaiensis]